VGHDGLIMQTSNGGKLWERQISGTYNWLQDVFFLNQQTGWVVGPQVILYTNNSGTVSNYNQIIRIHLIRIQLFDIIYQFLV